MEIRGFYFAGVKGGIKKGNKDLGLIYAPDGATCGAAFTTNRFKASHIILDLPRVKRGTVKALLVNSGNANACVGKEGVDDARRILKTLAVELEISEKETLMASTGIIGKRLPVKQIEKSIPLLIKSLSRFRAEQFAEAIITTDKFIKITERKLKSNGVSILGIAKGAGMIGPKMSAATMLAFILTDIQATPLDLYSVINKTVENTFNAISVDSQMSTNDSYFLLASGKSGVNVKSAREMKYFREAVEDVARELSEVIVRDGEGATCVIEIEVKGAKTERDAKVVAKEIGSSMLVKTAFHGGVENWGRIIQALGSTDASFKPEKVKLNINGKTYFKNGKPASNYNRVNKRQKHSVIVDLGEGRHSFKFLSSDLSEEYVKINVEYN